MLKKLPSFSPSSSIKIIWDFFVLLAILMLLFFIPIHISFNQPIKSFVNNEILTDLTMTIIIMDIIVSLNTGYYEKGILIRNK